MAGYGNKTRTDPEWDGHTTRYGLSDDASPYQGAHKYKSGTVAGAGFGNKTRPEPQLDAHNGDVRFGNAFSTEPYSGGSAEYKSGTVGGAGFGNKTSRARKDSASSTHSHGDSVLGRAMEKIGEVTHVEKLVEKGHERRASKGAFDHEPAPASAQAPLTVVDV